MSYFDKQDWINEYKLEEIFEAQKRGMVVHIPKAEYILMYTPSHVTSPCAEMRGIISLCERVNNPENYGWNNVDELKEIKEFCNSNEMLKKIFGVMQEAWKRAYDVNDRTFPFSRVNKQLEIILANEGNNIDEMYYNWAQNRLDLLSKIDDSDRLAILIQNGEHKSYSEVYVIKELLERGAKPNIDCENSKNSLFGPSSKNFRGKDVFPLECAHYYRDVKAGIPTDDDIIEYQKDAYYELTDAFLKAGADPNHQNAYGKTALFYAFQCGDLRVIKRLEEANANFGIKDKSGKLAIDYCQDENIKQLYKDKMDKIRKELQKEEEKKELEARIKANKEAILKRRAEKKEAQDLFIGNKDKKIYTIDDLEFDDDDTASLKLYNGLEFLVTDYWIYDDGYDIEIRSGGKSIRTDLSAKYGNHFIRFENNSLRVSSRGEVAEVLKYAQLLDADGKLCRDPHVVSGVVAADKIADGIRSGIIAGPVNHERARIMAENVKMKWLKQKNQKG